jgi:hypothetical protein
MDPRLVKVRVAAADKESVQFHFDNTEADLCDRIREGLAQGIPPRELAAASGLPLSRIRKISRSRPLTDRASARHRRQKALAPCDCAVRT